MLELNISPDFTVEDIHKVREYNYLKTKDMTPTDRRNYYKAGAMEAQKRIDEIRKVRQAAQHN